MRPYALSSNGQRLPLWYTFGIRRLAGGLIPTLKEWPNHELQLLMSTKTSLLSPMATLASYYGVILCN